MNKGNKSIIDITPFFNVIKAANNEIKRVDFVYDGNVYSFYTYSSKTVQPKTLARICAGLNHLLAWAKTSNETLEGDDYINDINKKRDFIIQFSTYIHGLHEDLTSNDFDERCTARLAASKPDIYGRRPDLNDIRALALSEWIEKFMNNNVIMNGIIQYVYEFININTLNKINKYKHNKNNLDKTLNKHDLFTLTCMIPISKIIYLAYSVFNTSTKADELISRATNYVVSEIDQKIIRYMSDNALLSSEEITERLNNDFSTNLIDYIESHIIRHLGRENNRSVFENIGFSDNYVKIIALQTSMMSMFKVLPVFDMGEKAADETAIYDYQENWFDYKYVSNCTVQFLNGVIKKALIHKSQNVTKVITSTMPMGDSTDSNTAYKQEMFLESRDSTALKRKKKIIKLLNKWAINKLMNMEIDFINENNKMTNVESPLKSYMLMSLLSELAHDMTTYKLMDVHTKINISVVLTQILKENGYPKLAKALVCKGVTPPGSTSVDLIIHKIKDLNKYKVNPIKLEKYIRDVTTRVYIPLDAVSNEDNLTIGEEFIQFLKDKEDGKIKLMDEYIYKYDN